MGTSGEAAWNKLAGVNTAEQQVPGWIMVENSLDPTFQVSVIEQCLSSGKRPIGLLLGAGCPSAIRLDRSPLIPDIDGISKLVKERLMEDQVLGDPIEAVYDQLESDGYGNPTVEDTLTHIRALRAVAGSDVVRELSADQLDHLDNGICEIIYESVNRNLPHPKTPYHRIAQWSNSIPRDYPVEIFTTNYDMLIEQALEETRVPYFDGFSGARRPLFDPMAIEQGAPLPHWTRLWKLHGSINWYQDDNLDVFRGTTSEAGQRRVIHPSHLKYRESRRMPYLAMLDRLRSFLRGSTAALVVCGYSFRDEHINETIVQGLQHSPTAVAFALMYEDIEKCPEATALAEVRPNLNVIARDAGVIGGRRQDWLRLDKESVPDVEQLSITWDPVDPSDANSKLKATFRLGDFAVLGLFLQQLAGEAQRSWEEPRVGA